MKRMIFIMLSALLLTACHNPSSTEPSPGTASQTTSVADLTTEPAAGTTAATANDKTGNAVETTSLLPRHQEDSCLDVDQSELLIVDEQDSNDIPQLIDDSDGIDVTATFQHNDKPIELPVIPIG